MKLNAEMVKVIQLAEFRKRMDEIGAEPIGDSSAQRFQQIKGETRKFANLVKDAKVTIESAASMRRCAAPEARPGRRCFLRCAERTVGIG